MKIIRVFPTRTRATPDDENVRIDCEPGMFDEADQVHISVLFTWDRKRAEQLAEAWLRIAPVKIGGPGWGDRGGDFMPGMYVKRGYVITSRGCPNRCWFCKVPEREGDTRELPIMPGNNLLDDNILACSDNHILNVFNMLRKNKPCQLTGGLEAEKLKEWHAHQLRVLRPKQIFFAYDSETDRPALKRAGEMMREYGFKEMRCYVLCGYKGDTFDKAEERLRYCLSNGFMPMAMAYRDDNGKRLPGWVGFQKRWARPAIIRAANNG